MPVRNKPMRFPQVLFADAPASQVAKYGSAIPGAWLTQLGVGVTHCDVAAANWAAAIRGSSLPLNNPLKRIIAKSALRRARGGWIAFLDWRFARAQRRRRGRERNAATRRLVVEAFPQAGVDRRPQHAASDFLVRRFHRCRPATDGGGRKGAPGAGLSGRGVGRVPWRVTSGKPRCRAPRTG